MVGHKHVQYDDISGQRVRIIHTFIVRSHLSLYIHGIVPYIHVRIVHIAIV